MKRMRFVLGLLTGVLLVIALAVPTTVMAQESAATTSAEASGGEAATETAPAIEAETAAKEAAPETAATEAETSAEEAAPETAPPTEAETTPEEESPESPPSTEPGTAPEEESPESPPSAEAEPTQVEIDIKPGSDPNSINLKSKGVAPVAVLTTDDFDASTVDPNTVEFAGASPVRWILEDVDSDGDMDMLFHFKTQELDDLTKTSTEAILNGTTSGGISIQGTDTVNIVPKGK